MKYRAVAEYASADDTGRANPVSGKEADDAYAPLGPLAAVGATVAFHGDVTRAADRFAGLGPRRDRALPDSSRVLRDAATGRLQEPARAQGSRHGVHDRHVVPPERLRRPRGTTPAQRLVLSVERGGTEAAAALPQGVELVADFTVEGVIVGDERGFDRARFVQVADDTALAAIVSTGAAAGRGARAGRRSGDRPSGRLDRRPRRPERSWLTMDVLRTPDERFADLEDYDFAPALSRGRSRPKARLCDSTSWTRDRTMPHRCCCCTATRLGRISIAR